MVEALPVGVQRTVGIAWDLKGELQLDDKEGFYPFVKILLTVELPVMLEIIYICAVHFVAT